MFWLAKVGFLPKKFMKLQHDRLPYISCLFGQAHQQPWQYKSSVDRKESVLKAAFINNPGQKVGVDQLILVQPGLVPQDKGSLTHPWIWATTIFIDYFTKVVYFLLITDQMAESALKAKYSFEHMVGTRNVPIKHYHANNGIFTDSLFCDDCANSMQRLSLCAIGAHHQNDIVKHAIKLLTLISRTLLLHAQQHWPEYITTMLWPLALKAAQDRMNQLTVNLQGRTPEVNFSDVASATLCFQDCHTWECPCYILDSRLQTNPKGVPKWEPRDRLGIYVGHSPHHAGNVALVLNPLTGLISPQFHIVFDDNFMTIPHLQKGTVPPNWVTIVLHSLEKTMTDFYNLTKTWFQYLLDVTVRGIIAPPFNSASKGVPALSNKGDALGEQIPQPPSTQDHKGENDITMTPIINLEMAGLCQSPRLQEQREQQRNPMSFTSILSTFCTIGIILATHLQPQVAIWLGQRAVNSFIHSCNTVNADFDETLNAIPHMIFVTGKENNECYTCKEMLAQPDRN